MAGEKDTEGEKHAREQLKKASIQGNAEEVAAAVKATQAAEEEATATEEAEDTNDRGRDQLKKKRSFEDMDTTQQGPGDTLTTDTKTTHTRKRSRDGTAESTEPNGKRKVSGESSGETDKKMEEVDRDEFATGKGKRAATPAPTEREGTDDLAEAVASPKTKRSRLHSATEGNGTLDKGDGPPPAPKPVHAEIPGLEKKTDDVATSTAVDDHADEEASKASSSKIPPTSGFTNTSSTSPFGALGGTRSPAKSPPPTAEPPQTAPSAFAASGFSALSSASTSGFGAIGKTSGGFGSGGSFATKSSPPDLDKKENDAPAGTSSAFGGALGQKSAFAAPSSETSAFGGGSASGFGKLGQSAGGSAFGGLGSGGLSSFASGKPTTSTSFKAAKPFGAPADEEEGEKPGKEDEEEGAGTKSPLATEEEPKDERFYEQDVETGEEEEEKIYDCRAKLYTWTTIPQEADDDGKEKPSMAKKEWRERGFGVLRLNVRNPKTEDGEDAKPKARFLLRAMGSHRVVLNTPVKKELTFGTPQGEKPSGGNVFLMGTIEGSTGLELLQLKMKPPYAAELYDVIQELKKGL
ncbi:hypothetical protein MBLNU230_g5603t2 [Neophaeotheca triangularis]